MDTAVSLGGWMCFFASSAVMTKVSSPISTSSVVISFWNLNGVAANRDELLGYGFSEEIVYYKRRWFVLREDAFDVLRRLLTYRKPIKDLTNCDETQSERTEPR
jgi:hypothetical protein